MAKKRAGKKADDSGPERKPMIAQLRGSPEWKAWIERAAARDQRSVASFIERAAVLYAKQIGITEDPPER